MSGFNLRRSSYDSSPPIYPSPKFPPPERSSSKQPGRGTRRALSHTSGTAPRPRRPLLLSCILCRKKKVKCDHNLPCGQCAKKEPGDCVYPDNCVGRLMSRPDLEVISSRITRLEETIESLGPNAARLPNNLDAQAESGDGHLPSAVPSLHSRGSETRVVDHGNWQAVLNQIQNLKSAISDVHPFDPEQPLNEPSIAHEKPSLLFGGVDDASLEDLVNSLPSKDATDRLINIFTRLQDYPTVPIHLPMFLFDYRQFWESPSTVSFQWLSILFSAIALALQFVVSSGQPFEGIPFPASASRRFASKAADCLKKSDYARPGKRTVEAMIMYLMSEHYWIGQQHFRASLALNLTIQVAMAAGYHRDPRHYPDVTWFEGEMRRRAWSFLVQLDLLFSSYLGLPRRISSHPRIDTELPQPVRDQDLNPNSPSHEYLVDPERESPVAFLNHRARLLRILGEITDYTSSYASLDKNVVLALGERLTTLSYQCPAWLRVHPTSLAAVNGPKETQAPATTNRAIEIDTLHQRCIILLHRKYLMSGVVDNDFLEARHACVCAANKALKHYDALSRIVFEIDGYMVGNWRAISILSQDFLLCAMVICFIVNHFLERRHGSSVNDPALNLAEQIELLQLSRQRFLNEASDTPRIEEAIQAIDKVLERATEPRPAIEPQRLEHDSQGFQGGGERLIVCCPSQEEHSQTYLSQAEAAEPSVDGLGYPLVDPRLVFPGTVFPGAVPPSEEEIALRDMIEGFSTGLNRGDAAAEGT